MHGAVTQGNAVSPVPRPVPQLTNLPFKALQKRWVEDALQKVGIELGNKITSVTIK